MAKKIILADDEAHILDVLSMKLTKAGFEVLTAPDGQRALDLCRRERPDLLITDCQMPRMDGLELCRQLQSHDETRGIPAIMLTAREFEIRSDVAEAAGIASVLPKPFSPRQVLEKAIAFFEAGDAGVATALALEPEPNQIPADPNPAGRLVDLAARLEPRLTPLGATLSVWDARGTSLSRLRQTDLCRSLCGGDGCSEHHRQLAAEAVQQRQPRQAAPSNTCWLLATPIVSEDEVCGAAVVAVPVAEMVESPEAISGNRPLLTLEQSRGLAEMISTVVQSEQAQIDAQRKLHNMSSNLSLTYEELELVYRLSAAIRINQSPADFMRQVCDELHSVLDVGAVAAIIHPQTDNGADEVILSGSADINAEQIRTLMAAHVAPRLAEPNGGAIDNNFAAPASSGLGAVRSWMATALTAGDACRGVLICLNRKGEFDSVDLKLITSVGGQSATFLANNALYADMQELFMGVLRALAAAIDAKDAYTGQHSDRVANLSKVLAERMGLDEAQIREIHLAGMLHDIGKIGVPEQILCKPGKLTDEEFELLKKHPGLGGQILKGIRKLDGIVEGIVCHHERPDGRGYPRGLKGDDIPISGRIICLADSFDAMASDRPYRKALPMDVVLEEVRKNSGTQFDPQLVEIFLSLDLDQFTQRSE